MAITKNVPKVESVIRLLLGGILVLAGLFWADSWKLAYIVVGAAFVITALVGY